jgi:hypothetical protein
MNLKNRAKRAEPGGKTLPGGLSPEARQHLLRCRTLPPPTEAEVARLIDRFLVRGGAVTRVSTAYVLPTHAAPPPAENTEHRDAPTGH